MNRICEFSVVLVTLPIMLFTGTQAANVSSIQARVAAAEDTSYEFLTRLGGQLKRELADGGPESAISVCRDVAPAMATELSLRNGWQVSRVSTKPRNSLLGMPDAWEQNVLNSFEERVASGETVGALSYYEVVDEPIGQSFRYMLAIETGGLCLSCHASPEHISEGVATRLNELYPYNQATGYDLGDLRGAISIKQPIQ